MYGTRMVLCTQGPRGISPFTLFAYWPFSRLISRCVCSRPVRAFRGRIEPQFPMSEGPTVRSLQQKVVLGHSPSVVPSNSRSFRS